MLSPKSPEKLQAEKNYALDLTQLVMSEDFACNIATPNSRPVNARTIHKGPRSPMK